MSRPRRCVHCASLLLAIVGLGAALVDAHAASVRTTSSAPETSSRQDTTSARAAPPIQATSSASAPSASTGPDPLFDEKTLARIFQHSPLPELPSDPTNAHADDPFAAHLGRFLFYDRRLSENGKLACASCHDPARSFGDGRALSQGRATGTRNTPALWNAAWQRWYFWDGRADSLWSQALKPLEHETELGSNRLRIAHLVTRDGEIAKAYATIFGPPPDLSDGARFPSDARPMSATPDHPEARAWSAMSADDKETANRVFANVGKALAAFERRIVSRDAPFDRYVAALRADDGEARTAYPDAARRGLALFVGKANCRLCHAGPGFTDDEFHNIGVPALDLAPSRDAGRHAGLGELADDPFNAAGAFSDDPAGARARELGQLVRSNELWGQFKTPTLRNVARTAPYMHQGQFASLADVVRYYSTLEGSVPAGHHGEQVIRPLHLAPGEIDDLVAFLESLTDESALGELAAPPASPVPPRADER